MQTSADDMGNKGGKLLLTDSIVENISATSGLGNSVIQEGKLELNLISTDANEVRAQCEAFLKDREGFI